MPQQLQQKPKRKSPAYIHTHKCPGCRRKQPTRRLCDRCRSDENRPPVADLGKLQPPPDMESRILYYMARAERELPLRLPVLQVLEVLGVAV